MIFLEAFPKGGVVAFHNLAGADYARRTKTRKDLMPEQLFQIVHEDDEFLAINKPAGLVTHPTKGDEYSSLVSRVRLYLGHPGHLINRLDRETSGIVMIVKTVESANALRKLWQAREVVKTYEAIVHGHPAEESGIITARLGKDPTGEVSIRDWVLAEGATAETEYRVINRFQRREGDFAHVEAKPKTGRKHQIRIHLSSIGHHIAGDKLYGADQRLYLQFVLSKLTEEGRAQLILPNHALHASTLTFTWRGQPLEFKAPPEQWFTDFLEGKDVPAWDSNKAEIDEVKAGPQPASGLVGSGDAFPP